VVFEELNDLFWLRGVDAHLATELLGLRWEGRAVGFDREVALLHADSLLRRHVQVSIRTGALVRTLALRSEVKRVLPPATPICLVAQAFFDERELLRLDRHLQRRTPQAPQLNEESAGQRGGSPRIYVYKVDSDWYEVDWELTAMSEKQFQLIVLAAYKSQGTIECQLVEARPRRRERLLRKGTLQKGEPVAYGQLRLAL